MKKEVPHIYFLIGYRDIGSSVLRGFQIQQMLQEKYGYQSTLLCFEDTCHIKESKLPDGNRVRTFLLSDELRNQLISITNSIIIIIKDIFINYEMLRMLKLNKNYLILDTIDLWYYISGKSDQWRNYDQSLMMYDRILVFNMISKMELCSRYSTLNSNQNKIVILPSHWDIKYNNSKSVGFDKNNKSSKSGGFDHNKNNKSSKSVGFDDNYKSSKNVGFDDNYKVVHKLKNNEESLCIGFNGSTGNMWNDELANCLYLDDSFIQSKVRINNMDKLDEINCHFSIRDPNSWNAKYKSAIKVLTASALDCNIIITYDANIGDLLPLDYPYLTTHHYEDVVRTIKYAEDTFNTPVWYYGLSIMKKIKEKRHLDHIITHYDKLIADILG